jgi:hypothetical protein
MLQGGVEVTMAGKKKTTRKCLRCGAPERVDSAGYSNLTQYVGPWCGACVTRER